VDKYLHPNSLQPWEEEIVSDTLGHHGAERDQAREWYRWFYETWRDDPLHARKRVVTRLDEFNDAFAKARLRGEHKD
jgi:hypothetical protein